MKNWKKDRNYRKYENGDGSFTYIITVDGENVEVSEEVYTAYSQFDRRERYCDECEEGLFLSLDRISEDGMHLSYFTKRHIESSEDTAIRKILTERMMEVMGSLPVDEQELIEDLFFNGVAVRELARTAGVYHGTIAYRRDKILYKMLRLM